ncbi:sugar ABC transporter permease [Microbacterium paludicola]|uniref:Sugar ABC transporter permease n=1 Tax=Microbacterium paludicola TaxID=300019 RepID=A0A4Y9FTA1_9MICO|nr:sugar ABC transporter permease [Microbacterium paludicola]MBF0817072.1 sugar ABC transporter permease [Microbacterium paludicola]TFU32204.1 sugar ABC transporter permease [Microbacterium paludicola]
MTQLDLRVEDARAAAPPTAPPRRLPAKRVGREKWVAYGFLAPWIAGLLLLTIGPMLYSLYLSFTDYHLLAPAPTWIGLDNYTRLFTSDTRGMASIVVTLVYVLIAVPLILVVSMLVALLLNSKIGFLTGYRALFYLPSLLGASVAVAALWRVVWGDAGIVNEVLRFFGIEHKSWTGSPDTALMTIIALAVWAFGSTMIIFLAGLRQVPRELYEAGEVDGAGKVRRFFSITVPMMTPIIFFNSLMVTIHAFQAFTPAYIISGGTGGPADSTLFYTLYLYQQGFAQLNMGYASALAWVLVAVLAAFTAVFFWSSKFWVFYGDK